MKIIISILFLSFFYGNVFADIVTKPIRIFNGHTDWIESVAFSSDGKLILSGSGDNTLKLWDANTGTEIYSFNDNTGPIWSVAFSPDNTQALAIFNDKTIKLWNVNSKTEIRSFIGHTDTIWSIVFSPDGKYILSGSGDKKLKLWDISSGKELRSFIGHTGIILSVAYSTNGKYALSGSVDNTVKLWDISSGIEIQSFIGHTNPVTSVAFSPADQFIISGSVDGSAKLWDMNSGEEIRSFIGHTSDVVSVAFSPDGQYVLSGSWDSSIKLWNVENGIEIRSFNQTNNRVNSIAFSPNSQYIISGYDDNTIKLWETGLNTVSTQANIPVITENSVTQANFFPTANFSVSTNQGEAPLTVKLDASSSIDPGGKIVDYMWTASDGQELFGSKAQITFNNSGTYNIKLTITDDGELTDTTTDTIIVTEPNVITPPVVEQPPVTKPIEQLPAIEQPSIGSNLAQLEFKGLKNFYNVGETIVIEISETVNRDRYTRVDLWMAIELPDGNFVYRTDVPLMPWSQRQQAYKTSIENTETSHRIFDFELPEGMGGDYTLYAAYVKEGENPVINGFAIRSNLVIQQIFLANRKD
ncbi:MAG TPA: PKD domain-containing protein [Thioploca sp.]|nr:PKD domain-containing protein [Thioploca sp.]